MAITNKTPKPLDWAKVLTSEARLTDIVQVDAIAAKYELPHPSVWKALSRLAGSGFTKSRRKGSLCKQVGS